MAWDKVTVGRVGGRVVLLTQLISDIDLARFRTLPAGQGHHSFGDVTRRQAEVYAVIDPS